MSRIHGSSLGWTQQRLAERIGVTQASINRWEKGHKVPKPTTLARFEEFEKLVQAGQLTTEEAQTGAKVGVGTIKVSVTFEIPLDTAQETVESVLKLARALPAGT